MDLQDISLKFDDGDLFEMDEQELAMFCEDIQDSVRSLGVL